MQNQPTLSTTTAFLKYIPAALLIMVCLSCHHTWKLPPGDPGNGGLIIPGGFQALVVTDSIGRGRHIAVSEEGDIYVKLTFNDSLKGRGGTVGLRDLNGDGKADSIVYFGDYTDTGTLACEVRIHDGYLYTSSLNTVRRNKMRSGELVPTSKTEIIFSDNRGKRGWHTTKPLAFDKEGHMYIPFGAPNDHGQDMELYTGSGIPNGKGLDPSPYLKEFAGVWQFNAEKQGQTFSDGKKFATGLRSIVGMTWNREDDQLYAVVNGIDNFHTMFPDRFSGWQAAVFPSEEFVRIKQGADFGWPYAYYDQFAGKEVMAPAFGGDGKLVGRAANYDLPVFGFPGHWAPMELLFYQGDQFPERYKKGVFIAFHGSTDRSPFSQAGYIVCFLPLEKGKATGDYEVFADGFTGVDTVFNTSDARYRPMGLAEGPDGSLYISESNKGKIWRIMYKGDKKAFGPAQLAELEQRKKTRTYIKTPDSLRDDLHHTNEMAGGILFNSYCASCHSRNGMGDNSRYPPVAGSEIVSGDKNRLIGIVLNGLQGDVTVQGKTYNGIMPPHAAFLKDDAIAAIVTYIRKSKHFKNNMDAVSPAEVARVRKSSTPGK